MNFLDRFITWLSPGWGRARAQARLMVRHYEAASAGRRTSGWTRRSTDANAAAAGATLKHLRDQARDLVRNNPWAENGLRDIAMDTVGWGIRPKATGRGAARVMELWKRWGETTECDSAGQMNFYAMQYLVMRSLVESGEVLIRRRRRLPADGLSIPLQLQVLEPDYIDTGKDGIRGEAGGKIIQGIEFDAIGRRVAYWLFDEHPGSSSMTLNPVSRRIPADGILHIFDIRRPGQVRGPSWFASVDARLHGFDEFEDATLMKQQIAACMVAFVTDVDGGVALGKPEIDRTTQQPLDVLEPGMIHNLPPGKAVTIANPPPASDYPGFSASQLRGVAAGLGVTYEGLTGDYSQTNYSSARAGGNRYSRHVYHWQENILIPQFCAPVWMWMLETLTLFVGEDIEESPATWTPPPMALLDPDKEGSATTKAVRAGQKTHDQMVREQGYDPDEFWDEYKAGLKRLDDRGIILDSDPRRTTTAGQAQAEPDAQSANAADGVNGSSDRPDRRFDTAIFVDLSGASPKE